MATNKTKPSDVSVASFVNGLTELAKLGKHTTGKGCLSIKKSSRN
jgi:hypothetical protein